MTRVPFTQNHRWHLPFLLLVFCCSFFINNGAIFADIMESRNIITAREMVYDHNWLVPTMNGELRLEKPPLPTWIAAITEMISPDDPSHHRDPSQHNAIKQDSQRQSGKPG